jgi:hypothetical protein
MSFVHSRRYSWFWEDKKKNVFHYCLCLSPQERTRRMRLFNFKQQSVSRGLYLSDNSIPRRASKSGQLNISTWVFPVPSPSCSKRKDPVYEQGERILVEELLYHVGCDFGTAMATVHCLDRSRCESAPSCEVYGAIKAYCTGWWTVSDQVELNEGSQAHCTQFRCQYRFCTTGQRYVELWMKLNVPQIWSIRLIKLCSLNLTKIDIADELPGSGCWGFYKYKGEYIDGMPANLTWWSWSRVQETLPGWTEDITTTRADGALGCQKIAFCVSRSWLVSPFVSWCWPQFSATWLIEERRLGFGGNGQSIGSCIISKTTNIDIYCGFHWGSTRGKTIVARLNVRIQRV